MYTFKLQAVLDHRQFIEDSLNKELAEIRQQAMDAHKQLEKLVMNETQTADRLKKEQAEGLSSDRVLTYQTYLRRLGERIENQKAVIAALDAKVENKRREVLEAMKNRQILEKLKEQDIERFKHSLRKKEMAFIDEVAVTQYARKSLNRGGKDE